MIGSAPKAGLAEPESATAGAQAFGRSSTRLKSQCRSLLSRIGTTEAPTRRAGVNAADFDGTEALRVATPAGYVAVVRPLVSNGAKVTFGSRDGT